MSTAAGKYADTVLTMSQVTGVAAEDLQKWEYASQFIDTSVETITGSMKKLTTNMASGSKETANAFQQLGVSVTDSTGQMRSSEDVFWDIVDALGKVDNETQRDQLAMQLLGRSAQELNPLIEAGSKAFKDLGDQAQQAGLIMSDQTLKAFGDFDDSVNKLSTSTTAAGRAIAAAFLPAVNTIVSGADQCVTAFVGMVNGVEGSEEAFNRALQETIGSVSEFVTKELPKILESGVKILQSILEGISKATPQLVSTLGDLVKTIGQTILEALPIVLDAGRDIILSLADGLIQNMDQVVKTISDIVISCVDWISSNLDKFLSAAFEIVSTLVKGLVDRIPDVVDAIIRLVESLVNWILSNLDLILDAAFSIVESLCKGLLDSLPKVIDAISRIIMKMLDWIISNLDKVIETALRLIMALVKGLLDNLPKVVDAISQIVNALLKWIIENLDKVIATALKIVLAIAEALIQGIPQVLEACGKIVSNIISGIGDAIKSIPEIGRKIIEGLWNGIINAKDWLAEKLRGLLSWLPGWAKQLLGINSPSKVFADIGEDVGLGLAEGIASTARIVYEAMEGILPSPTDLALGADAASVAGRVAAANDGYSPWQDDRPIILTLNDRELGRAVRGYV